MFTVSLVVSLLVVLVIAMRQWLPPALRIWHVMAAGALVLLLAGEIEPGAALAAIDWNVIAYLFGVFSIAAALYDSGISHALGRRLGRSGQSSRAFLLFLLAAAGGAAALTNDAAAVIGVPVALMLAGAFGWPPGVPLVALCAAVTVGSMATPIGNPQNILVATSGGVPRPLADFALWLAVPSLASLAFAWFWLARLLPAADAPAAPERHVLPLPQDTPRTWPAYAAAFLLIALIGADGLQGALGQRAGLPYGAISLIACAPVYLFGRRRLRTLREVDWATLIFFAAMFVVTAALMRLGALQAMLAAFRGDLGDPATAAVVAFWGSQVVSNVPLVTLYLQLLPDAPLSTLMMLAGVATLAGNLLVISAASNVIVVQQAEKFGPTPFTFWRFAWMMLPVTVVSVALTYGWVSLLDVLL